MKIKDFLCEQWMTKYENNAVYNMTDTSFQALSLKELVSLDEAALEDIVLDYGEIYGDKQLRREILKLYAHGSIDEITCFPGALNANQHVMDVLLEPGDHVIAFVPGYQQFYEYPRSLGCEVSLVSYQEKLDWMFDWEELENSFCANTKMIVMGSPSNPTGATLSAAHWDRLIGLCRERGIYILCDEVYRGLDLEQTPSVSDLYERGISCSSLSKIFSLPGLRLGWVKADKRIIDDLNVRRDYTMISTGPLSDRLGIAALRNKEVILKRNREMLARNQQALKEWLRKNDAFSVVCSPLSPVAFLHYSMNMGSVELCERLLQEYGVFFVPGSCFKTENYVRLGMGRSCGDFEKGLSVLSKWSNEALKKV